MLPSFSGKLGQIKISSFDCARSSMDREYEYGSEGSGFESLGVHKMKPSYCLQICYSNLTITFRAKSSSHLPEKLII